MAYYHFQCTGDLNDQSLCFIEDAPEGMGLYWYTLAEGEPAGDNYPPDARITLREEHPGIVLADFIGNTRNFMIASPKVRAVIEALCPDLEIDFHAFSLINHKNRVHTGDYLIINPLGGFDCLDEEASGITYDEDGDVEDVEQIILDPDKLKDAPHLFRIDKDPEKIVFSKAMLAALRKEGVTNLLVEELEIG